MNSKPQTRQMGLPAQRLFVEILLVERPLMVILLMWLPLTITLLTLPLPGSHRHVAHPLLILTAASTARMRSLMTLRRGTALVQETLAYLTLKISLCT